MDLTGKVAVERAAPTQASATFGALLRNYRLAAGLTQDVLAERSCLSVRGIADLERGARRYPYSETIARLVSALALTSDEAKLLAVTGRRPRIPAPPSRLGQTPIISRRLATTRLPGKLMRVVPSSKVPGFPTQGTSFIGRRFECGQVLAAVRKARLVTLVGPAGVGKTRLAIEAVRRFPEAEFDALYFVDLAPLRDPALLAQAILLALGWRGDPGPRPVDIVGRLLGGGRSLIVLDNCEHLVDECARLADALVRGGQDVRVLATSREALRITGEIAWLVPSLSVPDPKHLPPWTDLRHNPAVRLFVDRAQAAERRFTLTKHNSHAVAEVCAQLDGNPLALELAAARVPGLSIDQLAARLNQRFRLLSGGSRVALPRQQTLKAALDWSYDLLCAAEKCLFNRLSVFAGGWTFEAAEMVCCGDGLAREDVLDLLGRLVSKSLVTTGEADRVDRYRLLETVRQYAAERLADGGNAEAIQQRHASYYLEFVEALDPEQLLRAPALGIDVLTTDQLERERDNLRASLRWWIDSQDSERAVRQATAVFPTWFLRGGLTEGRSWLEEVLLLPAADNGPDSRAHALTMLGNLARRQGEYGRALDAFQELLAARLLTGDRRGTAQALGELANVHQLRGDYVAAWAGLDASRDMADDSLGPLLADSWRFVGGQVALHEGRYDLARLLLTEALHEARQPEDSLYSGYCAMNLGTVAREQGEYPESGRLLGRGLELAERYGDTTLLAHSLEGLSGLAAALGQHERAFRLGGAAVALREAAGAPLPPAWRPISERWREVSRAQLTESAANKGWSMGQAMGLEQAIADARHTAAEATANRVAHSDISGHESTE